MAGAARAGLAVVEVGMVVESKGNTLWGCSTRTIGWL